MLNAKISMFQHVYLFYVHTEQTWIIANACNTTRHLKGDVYVFVLSLR